MTTTEFGVRHTLTPTPDGGWRHDHAPLTDPLADANTDERRFFQEHYQGLPPLELMRRLRRAEWDARFYKEQADERLAQLRQTPPSYRIEALADAARRVQAVLEVPRRRTIPKAELAAALGPVLKS